MLKNAKGLEGIRIICTYACKRNCAFCYQKIRKGGFLDNDKFKKIIENSNSYLECCKNLGVSNSTTIIKAIKKRIKELNLSVENLSNWKKQKNSKYFNDLNFK